MKASGEFWMASEWVPLKLVAEVQYDQVTATAFVTARDNPLASG